MIHPLISSQHLISIHFFTHSFISIGLFTHSSEIEIGGNIHGKVGLKLSREAGVFLKGIWVKLQFTSMTKNKNPVIEKMCTIDHLKNEDDYISGGLYHVLVGVCIHTLCIIRKYGS